MPNLREPQHRPLIEFVASPALDLLNAMYFTMLADFLEGVEGPPALTRQGMAPALRDELDLLFSYPRTEPGIMGALNDVLFAHPRAWDSIDDLLQFVRDLPADGTANPQHPGIQGLALYALRWGEQGAFALPRGLDPRAAMARALDHSDLLDIRRSRPAGDEGDEAFALALFDDPESVRARILHLLRRFYDEHYRPEEARRLAGMRASVEAHRREGAGDPVELSRRLLRSRVSCLENVCSADYERHLFLPSFDVGLYSSCIDLPGLHAIYYPCEPQPGGLAESDDDTQRMALVYKALGDEQRLRILHLLREREMYAQEIVERAGIHQSVVSRHLSFLRAVDLVRARRQNNMKFFSINPEMGDELRRAAGALLAPSPAQA